MVLIVLLCLLNFVSAKSVDWTECSNLTNIPSESTQVLLVSHTPDGIQSQATITACENLSGKWVNSLTTFQAVVGKNGVSQIKQEGDNITPAGLWPIGEFFGWYPLSDPVVQTFQSDYRYVVDVKDKDGKYYDKFVDDVESPYYNTWVSGATTTKSYEQMRIPAYKYGLVINYNMYPTVKGKGSAIFLHIWSGPNGYTAGCVALEESNLIQILQWLDKAKQPLMKIVAPVS